MTDTAVVVDDVWKRFRIFHERNQYLKASVLRGRRARYEEFWALKGVSFEVKKGEVFGIIGENGSGKSTLLKCLAGILRPERGTIQANGRLAALLELGAGFHPELSGRENIALNAAILGFGRKEIASRFDEIVEFSGLERFIDTPVKNYSSGMYVRLGFSVAINVDPDILVIDEVLGVGDAAFSQKCSEKFAELRNSGKTLIIVTHDLGSIRSLCDRAVWLQYGTMREVGSPGEVVDDYYGETMSTTPTETAETRWGSGEIRITHVELLDRQSGGVSICRTGDDVTVRVTYEAHTPVERPVFSLEINHLTGTSITAPTGRDAGAIPDRVVGPGTVDVSFRNLALLPGAYHISVAVRDFPLLHTYDHVQNVVRFDVHRGSPGEDAGLVTLSPIWSFS